MKNLKGRMGRIPDSHIFTTFHNQSEISRKNSLFEWKVVNAINSFDNI